MNLNILDFRVTDANDFSVELLVDGKGIDGLEEADERFIPYWLFETNDLPSYFNHYEKREKHTLGVCSCGEGGCGDAGCVLVKDSKYVYFTDIYIDGHRFSSDYKMTFARENYESVIRRILEEITKFKAKLD